MQFIGEQEMTMPDYRNPNDPFYRDEQVNRDMSVDTRSYNATWGWIAGALFLVVILAIAFGIGHEPTMTASNDTVPPASTRMAPPTTSPSPLNPTPAQPQPSAPAPAAR
jgi:hypothetical protein